MRESTGHRGAIQRAQGMVALVAGSVLLSAGAAAGSECVYQSPARWLQDIQAAVARGEIADPATQRIRPGQPRRPAIARGARRNLTPADVFPYEDTNQVLLTDFSNGELIGLMVSAANDLIANRGDLYDFVGFWTNFTPHHTVGWAFYLGIENDVTGIGIAGGAGETFNNRSAFGVGGENVEGFVMMWDIRRPGIEAGSGPEAEDTRSGLAHEFAHRFAVYLPDLLGGRRMQGYGGAGCYDAGHWNQQVDAQGSAQGIADWLGSSPAVPRATFPDFYLINADTGGFFAYVELYLMGFVSPAEMDAGNSEFRYMDNWDCAAGNYSGPISMLSSADVIAAAGPRVPDSGVEDKHYRTGWIMVHQPGDAPNAGELGKAIGIHEQQQIDWALGTLGRGTMDNSLFDPTESPLPPEFAPEGLAVTAWPNPARGEAQLRLLIPVEGHVELKVYDVRGGIVRTLIDGAWGAGSHVVSWNGLDDAGTAVPSGIYFVKLSNGSGARTQKVSLVR